MKISLIFKNIYKIKIRKNKNSYNYGNVMMNIFCNNLIIMIKSKTYKKCFSEAYDDLMGDRKNDAFKYLDLIKKTNPAAKSVLDLACGTGKVLKYFENFKITGLDLSGEMLSMAKKSFSKNKNVKFIKGDITKFSIKEKFDCVTLMFDSINHLLTFTQWEKVFENASKHLNSNGVFIFDINTAKKINRISKMSTFVNYYGENLMLMKIKLLEENISNWNIKIFIKKKGKNYEMYEENIKEKTFETSDILKALQKYFKEIEVVDFDKDNEKIAGERLYFVCKI
jgi:SAM-dependent methyltransferase